MASICSNVCAWKTCIYMMLLNVLQVLFIRMNPHPTFELMLFSCIACLAVLGH